MAHPLSLLERLDLLCSDSSTQPTHDISDNERKRKKKKKKNPLTKSVLNLPPVQAPGNEGISGIVSSNHPNRLIQEDKVESEALTSIPAATTSPGSAMMPATGPSAPPTLPSPSTLSTVSNHPPIYKPLDPTAEYISLLDSDDEPQDMKNEVYQEKKSEKARGKEPVGESSSRYEREWDRGKPEIRTRSRERSMKRKHDAIDYDDGYANKKQRLDAASRKAPWILDTNWDECRNVSEMLHKEVEAFTKWMAPTPIEDEVRELTVQMISKAITTAFSDSKVFPFGSYETKLYLPSGDIDLVVVSDMMAYSNKSSVLHSLASVLRRAGIASNVTVIAKAKVPIVKFVTLHGRFNVDISINQTNGIFGGQVVKGFLQHLVTGGLALRSLVFITKQFLSQRSMNEVFTGGLGSYSIVCLAISFLQMHPKIRRGEIDPEQNLGVLVMEFFELYGCHFNYDEVGISIRDGGTYFNKRTRGWYNSERRGSLSIEDPVDPSNDISSGSFGFPKVRTSLAGAHGILTATAYHRAASIEAKRKGRSFSLRKEFHPEDMSILSSVMGVTQETINHRRLVQEVYDKRTLHNILQVKPKTEIIVDGLERERQQRSKRVRSPEPPTPSKRYSSWRDIESEEDASASPHNASRENEYDREESGKYDIGRQVPRKRRRKDKEEDQHTVFIDVSSGSDGEVLELEGREFGRGLKDDGGGKRLLSEERDRRRNYWLSKASGVEEYDSD